MPSAWWMNTTFQTHCQVRKPGFPTQRSHTPEAVATEIEGRGICPASKSQKRLKRTYKIRHLQDLGIHVWLWIRTTKSPKTRLFKTRLFGSKSQDSFTPNPLWPPSKRTAQICLKISCIISVSMGPGAQDKVLTSNCAACASAAKARMYMSRAALPVASRRSNGNRRGGRRTWKILGKTRKYVDKRW